MVAQAFKQIKSSRVKRYRNNPIELLKWITDNLPSNKVVMGTGFGPPGIVLLDMLFKVTHDISVFYIDTSFLFDQTYELRDKLQEKYGFQFLKFSKNPLIIVGGSVWSIHSINHGRDPPKYIAFVFVCNVCEIGFAQFA